MAFPIKTPVAKLAATVTLLVLAGCQPVSGTRPVPSVAQIGSELKCAAGDHAYEDFQAGWGFCYPGTWQYNERSQSSQSPDPVELDLTFDITDRSGLFAFMIVSTFNRDGAPDLASWEQQNLKPVPAGAETISWGNATEAAKLADGRRIALTPTHVVILELHSGHDLLDLETQMSTRLNTWKFTA
jgi:hypothetical protein